MKLDEILNASLTPEPEPEPAPKKETTDEDIEKLATYLEAFAEEDTLLDELARAAIVAEMLEKRDGH